MLPAKQAARDAGERELNIGAVWLFARLSLSIQPRCFSLVVKHSATAGARSAPANVPSSRYFQLLLSSSVGRCRCRRCTVSPCCCMLYTERQDLARHAFCGCSRPTSSEVVPNWTQLDTDCSAPGVAKQNIVMCVVRPAV